MKKRTKITSLFICVMMLCAMLSPMAIAADTLRHSTIASEDIATVGTRVGSIEIELTAEQLGIAPTSFNSDYRQKALPQLNAFFSPNQTYTESNLGIFVNDDMSIPWTAEVTSVQVKSVKTNVPNVTYYVDVGWVDESGFIQWCDAMLWNSTVTTTAFNGRDPYATWTVAFIGTRVIPWSPYEDVGAAASLKSVTIVVNYSY